MSIVPQSPPTFPAIFFPFFCWKTNCLPLLFLCPSLSGNMKVISMLSSQQRNKFLCRAKHRALYYIVHTQQSGEEWSCHSLTAQSLQNKTKGNLNVLFLVTIQRDTESTNQRTNKPSFVKWANDKRRVNSDNLPWFFFNSETNSDKCSQTSGHYPDRRCLPDLSYFLKIFSPLVFSLF